MSPKRKFRELQGVRLKFRTAADWVTATLWIDGEAKVELGRLRVLLIASPDAPEYQEWIDAMQTLFGALIERVGGKELRTMRRAPDYSGEGS